jgi:diaminohydroxyphosphoribosylaminopyrimidine deaminase/5-amino-6-(5-phosphoribosylamino)uracil reductase
MHERFMQRALTLAERGRGHVEPNPLVGAVVVQGDAIVGEGAHEKFGQAHAEVNALAQAGEKARGSTLYVTLEPCCHHGKTPPCTDAVLKAGVSRVVAAMVDPFAAVSGQGAAKLRAAGLDVDVGLCEEASRRMNAPYLKLVSARIPYVHAKWAMTLDGKLATRTGDSKWISGEESRARVHALRGRIDAIIAGIGTALADDPLLTARPAGPRTACRVILDSAGRLPLSSQLVKTAHETPVLVVVAPRGEEAAKPLAAAGCEVLVVPEAPTGSLGVQGVSIPDLLAFMGARRWTNVLVEGGAGILGAFLDARQIDEVHVYLAPKLTGGKDAPNPVAGLGCARIAEALSLADYDVLKLGPDLYIHGRTARP